MHTPKATFGQFLPFFLKRVLFSKAAVKDRRHGIDHMSLTDGARAERDDVRDGRATSLVRASTAPVDVIFSVSPVLGSGARRPVDAPSWPGKKR